MCLIGKTQLLCTQCRMVMYGCESWTVKKAEHEELMFLNYSVGGDS